MRGKTDSPANTANLDISSFPKSKGFLERIWWSYYSFHSLRAKGCSSSVNSKNPNVVHY